MMMPNIFDILFSVKRSQSSTGTTRVHIAKRLTKRTLTDVTYTSVDHTPGPKSELYISLYRRL